ncbi:MAG TPA: 16S rRNA processing protein RimM [Mollicutes bacterium]|jgi:16S rRNA processing protein RimM|nr:16S rRNA processing protein RimM [Mollicutes bacterium]
MEYIFVGEIINTHGVKGEVRLISDFKYKEQVFVKNFTLYVGRFKDELKIKKYRRHKTYDMITFEGIDNINDVIMYKGDSVYINKDDLVVDGLFNEQLIGLEVYFKNKRLGFIEHIVNNNAHDILVVKDDSRNHLIPNLDEFIEKVDLDEKRVYIKEIEGLINED